LHLLFPGLLIVRKKRQPTEFEQKVYAATREIPRGCVTTYRRLAARIGCGSARAVGQALRRNPFAPEVPCHRVIAANLTVGGFAGRQNGKEIRRKLGLLAQEGVVFRNGRLADAARLFSCARSSASAADEKRYWAMDRRYLWHPYTRNSAMQGAPFPLITRGEGSYLFDGRGRRYLDAISSWWCCNLGHSHPRLVAAITRQTQTLQHSILGNLSHPAAIELAARLAALFPAPMRVFFSSDGASAVEAALKIAVQYWHNRGQPAKRRFAALQYGYHGDTLGAVSVGYLDAFHAPFRPLLFPALQAEAPCCGTCARGLTPERCGLPCFDSMRAIVERHAAELAAVIVEPLCQCAAGMRIYPAGYLRRLARLCARHGVLLIADEIAVGFGRTGRMFAFEHAGIAPDIVCLGKGLSGGCLPISATVVKTKIAATFTDTPVDRTFYHGHTFAGNPIAAAAGLETLAIYTEERIAAQAARKGRLLRDGLRRATPCPLVRNTRCLGMIGAVELRPRPGLPQRIQAALRRDGILIRPLGDVIYLLPPLTTPDDLLAELAERFTRAIRAEA
jgi:adenosylmethionine-8-amino-7-oxononanoate aminotransferase